MKKKGKLLRNPYIRIGIVAASVVLIMAIIASALLLGYRVLFSQNPHFTLKHVFVSSPGYWNGRSVSIIKKLGLKMGETNIFAVDLKELRETLKEDKAYSIENVEASRILPDTLKFEITERIPRALLYNRESNLIVDKNGILLNSKHCVNIDKDLPTITGFMFRKNASLSNSYKKGKIPYGKEIEQVKPALALISLVNAYYPNFNIRLISLHISNSLIVYLPGPQRRKIIKVTLPFKHSSAIPLTDTMFEQESANLQNKLEKLKRVYNYLSQRGKACTEINLMFDKQAIINSAL